ncbi:hypothetical protein H1R20_g4638, partial [Candolleomyces eurysporus]
MAPIERTFSDMTQNPPFTQAPCSAPILTVPVSKVTGLPVRCPSDFWLKHPGWIDHTANPPRYYVCAKEINEALKIWGPITGIQQEAHTPAPSEPRSPLTPPEPRSPFDRDYELDQAMAHVSPTPVSGADAISALQLNEDTQTTLGDAGAAVSTENLYVVRAVFNHAAPLVPGVKTSKKSQSTVKIFTINIHNTNCVQFITAALQAHSLNHTFSPGTVSGPPIKLYWTGSAGGKTNAASILKEEDFDINRQALFRKKSKPEVTVEFSANNLEPFRIQATASQALAEGPMDENQELAYGTQVPQISSFNTTTQMHGLYILELKKKWKCEKHLGEHGDSGHCYVSADGSHIRLNGYRLKLWAAAWAAGDATKHAPPNIDAFDGDRSTDGPAFRARGRGQRSDAGVEGGAATGTSNDLVAMLVGALLPTLGRKRARSESASPRARPDFRTPARASTSTLLLPMSPLPSPGSELNACLTAFLAKQGIDFLVYETALSSLDLTPDIIAVATDSLLMDVLGATIGKVLKLKVFCESWTARQGKKKDVFM